MPRGGRSYVYAGRCPWCHEPQETWSTGAAAVRLSSKSYYRHEADKSPAGDQCPEAVRQMKERSIYTDRRQADGG